MFYKKTVEEMKKILKSPSFYIMIMILIMTYATQFGIFSAYDPLEPISNEKVVQIKEMPEDSDDLGNEARYAYQRILYDLKYGVTAKYTWGQRRWSKLTENEIIEMKKAKQQLEAGMSYKEMDKSLRELDKALGGRTAYGLKNRDRLITDTFYGYKPEESEKEKIKTGYKEMLFISETGSQLKTYFLINFDVKLTQREQEALREAMSKISKEGFDINGELIQPVSYTEYEKILEELSQKLGRNSIFSQRKREYLHKAPISYKEAQNEFKEMVNKDKVTNAYGRLLADYMGITAGFYPVFILVILFIKDRKKKARNSRDLKIDLLAKYTASFISILGSYLAIASHATLVFYLIGKNYGYSIDLFAFYKYTLWWVAPTLLFTLAVGLFIYTLLNNIIFTIAGQLILWGVAVNTLEGDYRLFRYMIRFNNLGNYNNYILWEKSIMVNRIFFVVLSLVLVVTTLFIKERKLSYLS